MNRKKYSIKLDKAQRKFVAQHIMQSGNAAMAGLVFAQIVLEKEKTIFIVMGFGIYFICWLIAVKLIRRTS